MAKSQEIAVLIEGLSPKGRGVGSFKGAPVHVAHCLPGDRVRVRIGRKRKRIYEGTLLELLEESPDRVSPRCGHFGLCGGCSFQNLQYQKQLEYKGGKVQKAFQKEGLDISDKILKPLPSPQPFEYRNKMEFSFGERWLLPEEIAREEKIDRAFGLGLHIPGRYDRVLDIRECHLVFPLFVQILKHLREDFKERDLSIYNTRDHQGYLRFLMIRQGIKTDQWMVNLVTAEDRPELMGEVAEGLQRAFPEITVFVNNITASMAQVSCGEEEKVYQGPGYITEKMGSLEFQISSNSFFQTNTLQAEKMYETVVQWGAFKADEVVYDFYCGTGTLSLFVASQVKEVVGIELIESAILDARKNAELNSITNCSFLVGDLKDLIVDKSWQEKVGLPDGVIIDPPRPGMNPKVVEALTELSPRVILYVSCNSATQARDLSLFLAKRPDYTLEKVLPIDMFPHTPHGESLAKVVRR